MVKAQFIIANEMAKMIVGLNPSVACAQGLNAIQIHTGMDVTPYMRLLPGANIEELAKYNAGQIGEILGGVSAKDINLRLI